MQPIEYHPEISEFHHQMSISQESPFRLLWEELASFPRLASGTTIEQEIVYSPPVKSKQQVLPTVVQMMGINGSLLAFEPRSRCIYAWLGRPC